MKKPYKIVFLRMYNEELSVVKEIEYNSIKQIITISNGKTFKLSLNDVIYNNKHQRTYFIDIDNGNQYKFNEIKAIMNPSDLDNLFRTKIIKELAQGIINNSKDKIISLIIGFIIGIMLGLLIMNIIMSGQIQNILTENQNPIIVPPFSTLLRSF